MTDLRSTAPSASLAVALLIAFSLATLILTMAWPEALSAQPALPSEPTQAPIGPGLGALAVAGGAYALRRLRAKKQGGDVDSELE